MTDRLIQVMQWTEKVFYKPGHRFYCNLDHYAQLVRVRIEAIVIDSTVFPVDKQNETLLISDGYVPEHVRTEQDYYKWLQHLLIQFEAHESKEWLRFVDTGKPVDDPHKYDRRAL